MISIVIPVWNQHDMTADCIGKIRENTKDFELIVIDNGSNPPIVLPFMGFTDATLIRNETNLGFPAAVNQGMRAAKGDTIVLLNNDVVVTPGWAERLLRGLEKFSIVGPMTNFCAGMQSMTMDAYQDYDELVRATTMWADEHEGKLVEVNWVIGFLMAFPRALFEELGPFDDTLWPCSGEEIDFCYRARAAGHRVAIVCDAYVHHIGSVTLKDMDVDYQELCRRNDEHLVKKWGADFWNQQHGPVRDVPALVGGLCLNLGCGLKHIDGYVNVDNRLEVKPDICCDVTNGLPWEDSSVDYVRAFDFLEHIPLGKTMQVVDEIWRVLKPGGVFESFTPDAEHGQSAFQDPHHLSFWVENSWLYYSDKTTRELYGTRANFDVEFQRVESGGRIFHLHVFAKAIK
jgi:GT2 family glycosyltransferase/predicted SAM-dependent methyltransferase